MSDASKILIISFSEHRSYFLQDLKILFAIIL